MKLDIEATIFIQTLRFLKRLEHNRYGPPTHRTKRLDNFKIALRAGRRLQTMVKTLVSNPQK